MKARGMLKPALFLVVILVPIIIFYMKYSVIIVSSNSMAPYLNVGDIIIVDKYTSEIQVGDIVVFVDPSNRLCVHRIVEIKHSDHKEVYLTKGDGNPTPDPWYLTRSEIVGKVVFKVPGIGRLLLKVSGLIGPMMITIGVLLVILAFTIPNPGEKDVELNVKYLKTLSKVISSGVEVEYVKVDSGGRLRVMIAGEEYIVDDFGIRPKNYITRIPLLEQASRKLRKLRGEYISSEEESKESSIQYQQFNKYKEYQNYSREEGK